MGGASELDGLLARLRAAGFDVLQPFGTAPINAALEPEHHLPDFGRASAQAVMVANSRALWPRFMAEAQPGPDPLNTWVEQVVTAAAAGGGVAAEVRFSHVRPWLPFLRLGVLCGLGWRSPGWMLIHPVLGPWQSLRAIVVLDLDGPHLRPTEVPPLCPTCDGDCRTKCALGAEYRFSDHQKRYHDTKDRARLWYQPYYCEENVWWLSRQPEHADSHVVFVSNPARCVAMWGTRPGRPSDGLITWDYHVVLLDNSGNIHDHDHKFGISRRFPNWIRDTFPHETPLEFRPRFRVVAAAEFHEVFESDRSHMRTADGGWAQPPPPWPAPGDRSTLWDLVDTQKSGAGFVCDLDGLCDFVADELASARNEE